MELYMVKKNELTFFNLFYSFLTSRSFQYCVRVHQKHWNSEYIQRRGTDKKVSSSFVNFIWVYVFIFVFLCYRSSNSNSVQS